MMDADRFLAERLQAREREEFLEVQNARLFVELIEKRRKHFANMRAQEKRNRPPTKPEMRSQMNTYLKNIGGYKHSQLKGKSFDEIKKLFDKEMIKVNTFITMDSEARGSSTKRTTKPLESDTSKKQKLVENVEAKVDDSAELKRCIEIVPEDEDDVTIDATPLSSKSLTIIDYKIHKEGKKNYFQINIVYYLLVEKMYPLTRNILNQLWNDVRLQVDFEVEMTYDLLRLIRRQIREGYVAQGGLLGLKDFKMILRVYAVQVMFDETKLGSS
ncbi:hypothetical protein Tco_0060086 [Tanacetum coccineum]